ncbi:MAG: FAD-dependent oxidoreductase [Crocinitomicaceae bacterium]
MSFLSFKSAPKGANQSNGTLKNAFSNWLLSNHGSDYLSEVAKQRKRPNAGKFKSAFEAANENNRTKEPLVGIVGGGFAGLFSGLILQSLGIEFELFESSDRVGGRIDTWYSKDYDPNDQSKKGLYGEVGGMRLPQFSEDMLPVQQVALSVNAALERAGLEEEIVKWRKFYYSSDYQRMRYNNMETYTTAQAAAANNESFNFGENEGGDLPEVWVTAVQDSSGNEYLPINMVLDQVNDPFITAINDSFAEGFALLMQYDNHSMWDYLTNVFTLGDLGEYYDPKMGPKSAYLPWSVASFLETMNVGTGMYRVSFVEMVIAVYDWGGSKNPYDPSDQNIYMLTVNEGMQHFPNACEKVLNLESGVKVKDGHIAQVQVGMLKDDQGVYGYNPPNLTKDAEAPSNVPKSSIEEKYDTTKTDNTAKKRVFKNHRVLGVQYDESMYDGHGGMIAEIENSSADSTETIKKEYPYVISTLPNGAYLNGQLKTNFFDKLSFSKAQAIRECNYMPSFKAFITFKKQFWKDVGEERQFDKGLGVATTDRSNRQIVYPSYGYDSENGVLQIYCWAQDAERLGALSDEERVNECLKGIAYLYPDSDIYDHFAGYDPEVTTKTWFWDNHAGGGAFALFAPGQFKNIYPTLLTPEFNGSLNIAGECGSVHHGWIVGALDSAYNAVNNILLNAGAHDKIAQMKATWGSYSAPDIASDTTTMNELSYAYLYNEVDRDAAAIAPGLSKSIYGDSKYVFDGNVVAFVEDFSKVPQTMKKTIQDKNVLKMLDEQWDNNVKQRAIADAENPITPKPNETAVEKLERIYYGHNFMTIPKPEYWLKDDAEFARQQVAGFMPNLLTKVSKSTRDLLLDAAEISNIEEIKDLAEVTYIADYRKYLSACTEIPVDFYLAKPIVLFKVTAENELMPVAIQLDKGEMVYTPDMPNAENAWLLAKMQTNCAGQTLHDVGFHQLLAHQICAMVSISLFSEEVFNPATPPESTIPFQEHPVFKLLRPHVVYTSEFQQTIYNRDYHPNAKSFPETRVVNASPGVYNIGFVYDLIFSCGRIGNYQLQDKMYYNDGNFRFLDLAITKDARERGVEETPFSYPYIHDASLWYEAIAKYIVDFVDTVYKDDDAVKNDIQLQRFFDKLIPAFNYTVGDTDQSANRFPEAVQTTELLKEVLTLFVWQFSVQHTVVNDGAYTQAAFVPNASTLMMPLPNKAFKDWTADDVLNCLPSQDATYAELGNMNFMDVQLNASVTGQGPYPQTIMGRGVLETSLDFLQDTYQFVSPELRSAVDKFYQSAREVGVKIAERQGRDVAQFYKNHPNSTSVPETVLFELITPERVMNTIQT